MNNLTGILVGGLAFGAVKFGYQQWAMADELAYGAMIENYIADERRVKGYLPGAVDHCMKEWVGADTGRRMDGVVRDFIVIEMDEALGRLSDRKFEQFMRTATSRLTGSAEGLSVEQARRASEAIESLAEDNRVAGCVGRVVNGWMDT